MNAAANLPRVATVQTHCVDCGGPLGKRTIEKARSGHGGGTGQCTKCWHAAARRPSPQCRDCGKPISRMSKGGRCHSCARGARDPAVEARRIEAVRACVHKPEVRAAKLRVVAMLADRRLNWCPESRRDDYRRLRKKGWGAARARVHIEATLTPFERQLAKVLSGARIVEKVDIRVHAPDCTLGGVSAGALADAA